MLRLVFYFRGAETQSGNLPQNTSTTLWRVAFVIVLAATYPSAEAFSQVTRKSLISGIQRILQQALIEAAEIEDLTSRNRILSNIAEDQAWSGDIAGAQQTIAKLPEGNGKDDALLRLASAQVKAGDIKESLHTVGTVSNEKRRLIVIRKIVVAQAKAGDVRGALRTVAPLINDRQLGDGVLSEIAIAQALGGDLKGALETASTIRHAASMAEVVGAVAVSQARTGDFNAALKTAGSIPRDDERFFALGEIAGLLAKSGDTRRALDIANSYSDKTRAQILYGIALVQAKAGDINGALRTSRAIERVDYKVQFLREAAKAQTRKGNSQGALRLVNRIDDQDEKNGALVSIAVVQAELGDMDSAMKTFALIPETSRARRGAMQGIAWARVKSGDVSEVLASAAKKESPYGRAFALLTEAAKLLMALDMEDRDH